MGNNNNANNTKNTYLYKWQDRVKNDLPGAIAALGALLEAQQETLRTMLELETTTRSAQMDVLLRSVEELIKLNTKTESQLSEEQETIAMIKEIKSTTAQIKLLNEPTKMPEEEQQFREDLRTVVEYVKQLQSPVPPEQPSVPVRKLPDRVSGFFFKAYQVSKHGDYWRVYRNAEDRDKDAGWAVSSERGIWELYKKNRLLLKKEALLRKVAELDQR